jgi:hypothetical protein
MLDPPVFESVDFSFSTYSKREWDGPLFAAAVAAAVIVGKAGFGSSGFWSYKLSFVCSTKWEKNGKG